MSVFGLETKPIIERAHPYAIFTSRNPDRLNHLLRFPRQAMSGWHVVTTSHELCGFAILNLIPQHSGRVQIGKIVDCFLENTDVRLWRGGLFWLLRRNSSARELIL